MFWIGAAMALVGGLVSIGLSRESVKSRYGAIKDYHLDVLALVILLGGLAVSSIDHLQSERSLRELQKTAGRNVTRSSVEQFIRRVAGEPKGTVQVKFMGSDAEAAAYANEIWAMLRSAGYDAQDSPRPWFFYGNATKGVIAAVKDAANPPPHAMPLIEAMNQIGLKVEGQHDGGVGDGEVFVEIGFKPN